IVVGSNIATIALVMGVCILWFGRVPTKIHQSKHDLTSFLLCAALLVLISIDTRISRAECGILGFFFILYIGFRLSELAKTHTASLKSDISFGNILLILFWFVILSLSSYYLVILVKELALLMSHVNSDGTPNLSLLGLTLISIATAIPETVSGFFALKRKHYDLFYGNLFSSLTFNSLLVPAVSGLILPMKVTPQVLLVGFPTFILLGGLFYLFIRDKEEMTRFEATGLFVAYALFVLYILV
ncbi:MAG TPA: hypothetical protein VK158_04395, partial [Acidobacteriota bacterium]|nr:hypothetical protein [Acidobacteriota bacterium]